MSTLNKTLGEIIRAARSGERPDYDDLRLALCAMDHLMALDRIALERLHMAEKEGMTPFLARSAVYQCEEHYGRVATGPWGIPRCWWTDDERGQA